MSPSPWTGGKRGGRSQAIGKSRGGLTIKIVALVDALENLVRFVLRLGQSHELGAVEPLLAGMKLGTLLADKAYDADWLREDLRQRGIQAVIPPKSNRVQPAVYDDEMYKWQHLIENCFQKLKEFKWIAMRPDKTDISFSAMIQIVATVLNSR